MSVQVACPNPDCGVVLSMLPEHFGRLVACDRCGSEFAVDSTSDANARASTDLESTSEAWSHPLVFPSRLGRYRLLRKLGKGGMGTVYLAHDTELDRQVALKIPNFGMGSNPEVIERFRREARTAAGFRHPNFCPIHDIGRIDGAHYLAMAFVEGETLRSKVDKVSPMPPREAAETVRTLALALAEAHDLGIIHRDLKPANVMFDRRGTLIIMDFGIARRTGTGTEDADLTRTGALLGTPHYMSPEQVRGLKTDLGPATDIYSLGVILYELTTGHRPFEGPLTLVIGSILFQDPPAPSTHQPNLDPKFEAICLKAMARKIEDRYPSMLALARALEIYLAVPVAKVRPPTPQPVEPLGLLDEPAPATPPSIDARKTADFLASLAKAVARPEPAPLSPPRSVEPQPRKRPSSPYAVGGISTDSRPIAPTKPVDAAEPSPQASRKPTGDPFTLIAIGLSLAVVAAGYLFVFGLWPEAGNVPQARFPSDIVQTRSVTEPVKTTPPTLEIVPPPQLESPPQSLKPSASPEATLPPDQSRLAKDLYLRGFSRNANKEYDEAIADFTESLRLSPEDPKALNALARLLATCPVDQYRDPLRAIDLATKACKLSSWQDAAIYDTLAAAYASFGDFEGAVQLQTKAVKLAAEPLKPGYQRWIKQYQQRKPRRDAL